MAACEIVDEAVRIVDMATDQGFPIRIMGACAVRLCCPSAVSFHERMNRELSDLDFMAYQKHSGAIEKMLTSLGYSQDRRIIAFHEAQRNFYIHKEKDLKADVFFDKLRMCHEIDFKGRLELEYPTITVSDLLLEKFQIVKITAKDIKDLIILFKDQEIGESEGRLINAKHISKRLSNDWGFYYTATTNLLKIKDFCDKFDVISEGERQEICRKIESLITTIDNEPKTLSWKLRAKMGTRMKWYNEVEELVRYVQD